MIKILTILLVLSILTSCAADENDLGDALGSALQNIEPSQTDSFEDASNSIENEFEQVQDAYGFENPNNIDYGAYNSVVRSYRKALSSSYGEPTDEYLGYFYANLVDFNEDDVYELVIARVHDSDVEGGDDAHFDPSSKHFMGELYDAVHIFYLDDDGAVGYAGDFSLSYYGEEGMQFMIEYIEVDGVNHLAYGGDMLDLGISSFDYVDAKVIHSFNGEYFEVQQTFAALYDYQNAGYDPVEYRQNMETITEEEYTAEYGEKWFKNPTSHIIAAIGYASDGEQVTENTIAYLDVFEKNNTNGDIFSYQDGNFLLIEGAYVGDKEMLLTEFLKTVTAADYETMGEFADEQVVEYYRSVREGGQYYPGLIIEDITILHSGEYATENITLMQAILESEKLGEMYREDSLDNTYIIKTDAKEIIDMDVVQYAGQYGLNVTQYYIVETGDNPRITAVYDSNSLWGESEAFDVAYITDYEQIFDAYGYEYPIDIMSRYFTEDELYNMEHYITDDAKEVYFIRNLSGGTIKVYENSIDDSEMYVRGDLLYETSGNVLYLGVRSDIVSYGVTHSDVQIVAEPFEGYETVYYPSTQALYPSNNLAGYAKKMMPIS